MKFFESKLLQSGMAANRKPRVFVDANVLIRGITLPRYPYEVLKLGAEGKITLVTSSLVLADVRYYLARLFPDSLPSFQAFLSVAVVEVVSDPDPSEVWANQRLVRDVKDIPVVLAAAAAGIDYLLSTDADLTDVDSSTAALRLRLQPAQVMRVGQFLHEVMGWSHAALEAISKRQWSDL